MFLSDIHLRPVTFSDSHYLWLLRNQADCRANSFCEDEISWETHERWFAQQLLNQNCFFYMIEFCGQSVGQIRLNIDQELIGEISISIDEQFRSLGVAKKALVIVAQDLANKGLVRVLEAYVKAQNLQSVVMFLGAGFKFEKTIKRNNVDIYILKKTSL